jgi:hypothetical protein
MQTDRSRILAFQRCPRERYLGYHIHGKGLQRKAKSLPLQFGSAFHEGAEELLIQDEGADSATIVELTVTRAQKYLISAFAAHNIAFDGEITADIRKAFEYGEAEQSAMAEALLRGWWAYEGESFLAAFEIIEVEKEGLAVIGENLNLMYRPDALVRERETGDLYVISWKTCATFGKRTVDQARTDMQSMSEVWGRLHDAASDRPDTIAGVLYKFAVKGSRRHDDWDDLYKQDNPLIYGWMKLGASPEETEWSWKYSWSDPDEINDKTGKPVGHKLGKGWKKVPIWQSYPGGVKAWIEALASQSIAPTFLNALESAFPSPLPVERRPDEIVHWQLQIEAQELSIANNLVTIENAVMEDVKSRLLDAYFPQHTASCHSFTGCPFLSICWENQPAEVGDLFKIRESNHAKNEEAD